MKKVLSLFFVIGMIGSAYLHANNELNLEDVTKAAEEIQRMIDKKEYKNSKARIKKVIKKVQGHEAQIKFICKGIGISTYKYQEANENKKQKFNKAFLEKQSEPIINMYKASKENDDVKRKLLKKLYLKAKLLETITGINGIVNEVTTNIPHQKSQEERVQEWKTLKVDDTDIEFVTKADKLFDQAIKEEPGPIGKVGALTGVAAAGYGLYRLGKKYGWFDRFWYGTLGRPLPPERVQAMAQGLHAIRSKFGEQAYQEEIQHLQKTFSQDNVQKVIVLSNDKIQAHMQAQQAQMQAQQAQSLQF